MSKVNIISKFREISSKYPTLQVSFAVKTLLQAAASIHFDGIFAQNLLSKIWVLLRLLFEGGFYLRAASNNVVTVFHWLNPTRIENHSRNCLSYEWNINLHLLFWIYSLWILWWRSCKTIHEKQALGSTLLLLASLGNDFFSSICLAYLDWAIERVYRNHNFVHTMLYINLSIPLFNRNCFI